MRRHQQWRPQSAADRPQQRSQPADRLRAHELRRHRADQITRCQPTRADKYRYGRTLPSTRQCRPIRSLPRRLILPHVCQPQRLRIRQPARTTNTETSVPTNTATNTATVIPTQTATQVPTDTPTPRATSTATTAPTNTLVPTNTATRTPAQVPTPSATVTDTATATSASSQPGSYAGCCPGRSGGLGGSGRRLCYVGSTGGDQRSSAGSCHFGCDIRACQHASSDANCCGAFGNEYAG